MPRPALLKKEELEAAMAWLPNWSLRENCLYRELKFAGFVQAWGFMNSVALIAEKMDHHPDWRNVYSQVCISLSTHDAGGITSLDLKLAAAIDALVAPP